jgi:hypothetical protein
VIQDTKFYTVLYKPSENLCPNVFFVFCLLRADGARAIQPNMKSFSEFQAFVDGAADSLRGKKVLMCVAALYYRCAYSTVLPDVIYFVFRIMHLLTNAHSDSKTTFA